MRSVLLSLSIAGISSLALATKAPEPIKPVKITLAFEDQEYPPWVIQNGKEGLDIFILKNVDRNLPQVEFQMRPVPWKRCLTDLDSNLHQGCFSASYNDGRKRIGVYPTEGGIIDPSKRLHIDSYSIFVNHDDNSVAIQDGTIKGLDLKKDAICVQSGYSIVSELRAMGFTVIDTPKSSEACFNILVGKRVRAVATLTDKGLALIKSEGYGSKIKILPEALLQKPYYLLLSYDFVLNYPEIAKSIFNEIEKVRESKAYQDEYQRVQKTK